MYIAHFGLKESPFSITPDPRYLYMSARHREALAHLLYGAREGGGFVQLTGEIGTGKTTICRHLLDQLPADVEVALILNPKLTALELLGTVCDELRIPYPAGTVSLKVLVDALYRHLLGAHARGRRTVLIIDEAQNLAAEVLEQIRLLTNLETAREKLLQIILIGQPELVHLLERQDLRQLAQRVTARYHLLPFSAPETRGYIRHRLEVAGVGDVTFTEAAMREVHRLAGGVPRLINVICDRSMLGAYAHDRRRIDTSTVRHAAGEVLGRTVRPRFVRPLAWSGAAVLIALAGGAAWLAVKAPRPDGSPAARVEAGAAADAPRPDARSVPAGDTKGPPVVTASPTAVEASGGASDVKPGATAGPRLGDVLADPSLRSDKGSALVKLYALWGVDANRARAAPGCESAGPNGLQCLPRTGTWTKLRRLNLPAVIELRAPSGGKHYATVSALGAQTATLEFGNRTLTAPLDDVEQFWDGPFVLLWRPPSPSVTSIGPTTRGKDVEWLRRRLSALDGRAVAARNPDVYDEALRERVTAFQRSRGLVPDGVAGEETLTHLSTALRDPGIPRLAGPRA